MFKTIPLFIATICILFTACKESSSSQKNGKLQCFVSILPQSYFVKRLGDDAVNVQVLVGAGQSPETFDPSQKQLAKLSVADVFFTINIPFENVLLKKIGNISDTKVVNTCIDVKYRYVKHGHSHGHDDDHVHEEKDPHVWLDPLIVYKQVEIIAKTLMDHLPQHRQQIFQNLKTLQTELTNLHQSIKTTIKPNTRLWVYHPAYGYFCEQYQIEQIAIEEDGKSPTARRMKELISTAKQQKVKAIFVQNQFMGKAPQAIAREVGCKIITVDPLAYNYCDNMLSIAQKINQFAGQ